MQLRERPELAAGFRRRGPVAAKAYDRSKLAATMLAVLKSVVEARR